MTQRHLDRAIADLTGESLRTVRRRGFSPLPGPGAGLPPEDLYLAIDCPHCKGPTPFPGQLADGSCPLAECLACDVLFGFDLLDVYVAAAARA